MADKWIQLMSEDGTDNLFPVSKMDLLWENGSPTSSFAAQTISLDLTDYDTIGIDCISATTLSAKVKYPIGLLRRNGGQYRYIVISSQSICTRHIARATDTGVEFGDALRVNTYGSGAVTDNTVAIPYHIYGIR